MQRNAKESATAKVVADSFNGQYLICISQKVYLMGYVFLKSITKDSEYIFLILQGGNDTLLGEYIFLKRYTF